MTKPKVSFTCTADLKVTVDLWFVPISFSGLAFKKEVIDSTL